MKRILIAEDEALIANFLEKKLREHGFASAVAKDGYSALNMTLSHNFDLLILDLGLPGKDGLEVIEELRTQGEQIPIIILTARSEVKEQLARLHISREDYLTKPFSLEKLLARVRLRLRAPPTPEPQPEKNLTVGNITLDLRRQTVKVGARTIELSTQESILLDLFMRQPERVFSREELLGHVWGEDYEPGDQIVNICVKELCKKLGRDIIETVRGVGYRFRTK